MGDSPLPGPGDGPGSGPPLPLNCDSTRCQTALAAVVTARNGVLLKCAEVEATKSRRDTFAAIGVALLTLAAALLIGAGAATATVIGIPLAALLFWAAVSVAATAVLFLLIAAIFEIQYLVQQGELNAERTAFANAASGVMAACPSSCWGDLSLPSCPD
jgi:hypothetical protein